MKLTDDDRRAIRRTCELLRMGTSVHWRATIDVMPRGSVWVTTATGQVCASMADGSPLPSPDDALAMLLAEVEP